MQSRYSPLCTSSRLQFGCPRCRKYEWPAKKHWIWGFMRYRLVRPDDETTRIMGEAFDAACGGLRDTGQPALVREIIAKRIVEAAKKGERDPGRLHAAGLGRFGIRLAVALTQRNSRMSLTISHKAIMRCTRAGGDLRDGAAKSKNTRENNHGNARQTSTHRIQRFDGVAASFAVAAFPSSHNRLDVNFSEGVCCRCGCSATQHTTASFCCVAATDR